MPATKWLTGPALKIEKKRAVHRKSQNQRRERDAPGMKNVNKIKAKDSTWSEGRCRICGARVWFDTFDGKTLPMDVGTRTKHRHEEG